MSWRAVSVALTFTTQLENAWARDGSNEVMLSCVVRAHPSPSVSWYHNDRNVDDSEHFSISYDPSTGRRQLTIAHCTMSDEGRFKCVARNAYGEAETHCHLFVLSHISTVPKSGSGQYLEFAKPIRPCDVLEGDTCTLW